MWLKQLHLFYGGVVTVLQWYELKVSIYSWVKHTADDSVSSLKHDDGSSLLPMVYGEFDPDSERQEQR